MMRYLGLGLLLATLGCAERSLSGATTDAGASADAAYAEDGPFTVTVLANLYLSELDPADVVLTLGGEPLPWGENRWSTRFERTWATRADAVAEGLALTATLAATPAITATVVIVDPSVLELQRYSPNGAPPVRCDAAFRVRSPDTDFGTERPISVRWLSFGCLLADGSSFVEDGN